MQRLSGRYSTQGSSSTKDGATPYNASSSAWVAGRLPWTAPPGSGIPNRSEEHTSELQSLMRISYAVFCLKKKITGKTQHSTQHQSPREQLLNTIHILIQQYQ